MTDLATLKSALSGFKVEDNPAIVKQKSRDFFWYRLASQIEQVRNRSVLLRR